MKPIEMQIAHFIAHPHIPQQHVVRLHFSLLLYSFSLPPSFSSFNSYSLLASLLLLFFLSLLPLLLLLSLAFRSFYPFLQTIYLSPSFFLSLVGLLSPQVTATSDSQLSIGDQLVLECTVSAVPHLVTQPSLKWERAPGDSLTTGIGDYLSHNLTVDKTSTAGVYTCVLTIDVLAISLLVTGESQTTLTVQSK